MKNSNLIVTFCLTAFLITFSSCEKEHTPSNSHNSIPVFSGYTATDKYGVKTGLEDATDWTYDDIFLAREFDLFTPMDSTLAYYVHDSDIWVSPAFPNSNSGLFSLTSQSPNEVYWHLRVVNQRWETLITVDSVNAHTLNFNLQGLTDSSDEFVRVYYFFTQNDSCVYKGHGDIKLD